jgi:hypothetical protein
MEDIFTLTLSIHTDTDEFITCNYNNVYVISFLPYMFWQLVATFSRQTSIIKIYNTVNGTAEKVLILKVVTMD